jgi:hypothetical protein
MLKRHLAVALCTVGVAFGAVLTSGTAAAAPPPKNGCPGSAYTLMTVDQVLEIATPGFEQAVRDEDANQDGNLCVKLLPDAVPLFDPTFIYYDNKFANPR